ncbi:phosphoethanolamine--lipid A transferase EptA [Luteimonas sp. SJ-92]|uniref:Phosphoethanolamine--lipid A transferase EptA n=1 Tax=Luteimonas salinisoli TaxID=2752307 RepID=A0A853J9Z0_9GAMM|nr:phosphoethanolamine--lipid A transferase EptA [Luteimonas salinisoli]NZA25488.1 phosphoethanolamine--lipid A transferase EptA [Luteimonas salinisoli]
MHALARRLLSGAFVPRVRWRFRTSRFILVWALFNGAAYHAPLYLFGIEHLDVASLRAGMTLLTLPVLVVAMTAVFIGLIALISQRLVKPFCMAMAVVNAIALYFQVTYGVVLDDTMMGNVFNTDTSEAAGLFHPWMLVYVFFLGIVPCWVLLQVEVTHTPFRKRLAMPVAVGLFTLCWAYGASQSWLWIDQYAKRIGGMVLPWSYAVNGVRYWAGNVAPHERRLLPPAHFVSNERKVVFLIIGESARAQNFSLYGYGRQTNQEMAKAGTTVFKKARSCATYTTASLECILAHRDPGARARWEPLTSYLQRHGVEVTWRTNNAGEPAMNVRHFERLGDLKAGCAGEACDYDEGLLRGIEARIAASNQQRILVVFHLEGSHGPAYNTRYPSRFNVFTPVCASVQLHQCSSDELVNAYDNTIVYTDFVVGQAIDMLKGLQGYSTSLIYVSDHGESLGEYNLYLHGTPWSIAPAVQKEIPLIVWDSSAAHSNANATMTVEGTFSHANVFHSVMGAFGMRSDVFDPALNLFSPERPQ